MYERIAFIKTAWADDYDGGELKGQFRYLKKAKGHEGYNFKPGPDGKYYIYAPPMGPGGVPRPHVSEGWLLVCIAKKDGYGPLTVVGWYEDAKFIGMSKPRPEYSNKHKFPPNSSGQQFSYSIVAARGYQIPKGQRYHTIDNRARHLGKPSIIYLRGQGEETWREDYAKEVVNIVENLKGAIAAEAAANAAVNFAFNLDPKKRKLIETGAVSHVEAHYLERGYTCESREREKCGYDLHIFHPQKGDELHVEVKGTSLANEGFFLTPNEHRVMTSDKLWRLAIVTSADVSPSLKIRTASEVKDEFDLAPLIYQGRPRV